MAKVHTPELTYRIKEFGLGKNINLSIPLVSVILHAHKIQLSDMAQSQETVDLHFLFGSIESARDAFQEIANALSKELQK